MHSKSGRTITGIQEEVEKREKSLMRLKDLFFDSIEDDVVHASFFVKATFINLNQSNFGQFHAASGMYESMHPGGVSMDQQHVVNLV